MNKVKLCAALCTVVLVSALPHGLGREISDVENADAAVLSEEKYLIKADGDRLKIYAKEAMGDRLIKASYIDTGALRKSDRTMLEEGIFADDRAEALMIFEDFLG